MTAVMPTPPVQYHYGERTYDSLRTILHNPGDLLVSSSTSSKDIPNDQVLDILSASRYPFGLMQPYGNSPHLPATKPSLNPVESLYGGLVLDGSQSDVSNTANTDKKPSRVTRKRPSKQMTAPDDHDDQPDSKKHRGRPRLDTHDETAADRRRTQIRLAQRAYRHRKESTISALKQKVLALQETVDQMNKTFLDLHDNMIGSAILTSHHSLGQQLHAAAEDFSLLSRITAAESDDEDDKIASLTKGDSGPNSEPTPEDESAIMTEPRRKSRRQRPSKKEAEPATLPVRLDMSSSEPEPDLPLISTTANSHDNILAAISQTSFIDMSSLPGFDDLMQYNVQVPDIDPLASPYPDLTPNPPLGRPLKAPNQPQGSYTYSFQETSFARRLHRMTLERGFRNLTNPSIDPNYIKRAFRFTFCFSNRKRIIARFQEMLKRRAGESLENWAVPFFNIGGAGTHFPRQDEEGNNIYPPNMFSAAKAFGPQLWAQPETPRTEATTQEMLEAIGFGGEWFDSHDVEEYLKTKGIFLDGHSSFVEVDPSVLTVMNGGSENTAFPSSDASSSTRSPHDTNINRTPSPFLTDGFSQHNSSAEEPLFGTDLNAIYSGDNNEMTSNSYTSLLSPFSKPTPKGERNDVVPYNDAWSNLTGLALGTAHLSATIGQPFHDLLLTRRRGPLTFDVELFLETMVNQSACLGRAPGFRKNDIDDALRLSVQESF